MDFVEEVDALYGQYNNNIKKIKTDSTLMVFTPIIKNPSKQIYPISKKNLRIGKFYLILYNYNGNKLWCPILTIPPLKNDKDNSIITKQSKIVNNKNLIYAINFDYLPIKYETYLINTLLKSNYKTVESNKDKIFNGNNVTSEAGLNVEGVYNFLRVNGKKNYCITAYDILKMEKIFEISNTILDRFVFIDTYYINNKLMYDTLKNIDDITLQNDFLSKIKTYEEILKMYYSDIEKFYISLRSFEKTLKLIDNI